MAFVSCLVGALSIASPERTHGLLRPVPSAEMKSKLGLDGDIEQRTSFGGPLLDDIAGQGCAASR